jgi:hypothetical protein
VIVPKKPLHVSQRNRNCQQDFAFRGLTTLLFHPATLMVRFMKPVTLAVFNSREEAEPMRQLLGEAGIWAEVRRETTAEGLLQFGRAVTGVKVEVPREDFEKALQLLYGWNTGDAEGQGGSWLPWMDRVSGEPRARREDSR